MSYNKTVEKIRWFAWAMFDFANSIFFVNVVSVYFPALYVAERGGSNLIFGTALAAAQILAGITAVFWGRFADRYQNYKLLLIVFVAASSFFTFLIGLLPGKIILVSFLFAFYFFAISAVFYEALLPLIVTQRTLPVISGLGAALGSAGNVFALLLALPYLEASGRAGVFFPTALGFLIFSLPTIALVRPRLDKKPKITFVKISADLTKIASWTKIYLLGRLLNSAALIGLIISAPLLGIEQLGLSNEDIRMFYIQASIAAALGALISGPLTKYFGRARILIIFTLLWSLGLFAIWRLWESDFTLLVPMISAMAACAMSSDRIFYLGKIKVPELGKFLGFHRLAYLAGAVLGPLSFGFIADTISFNAAYLFFSLIVAVAGLLFFFAAKERA